MNIARIKSLVDSKSYYSRSDAEVWSAINAAARYLYQAVIKESMGYWLKFDAASTTLTSGVVDYQLPADVQQLVRIRERHSSTDKWKVMHSQDINSDAMESTATSFGVACDGESSQFSFYGPYLAADDAAAGDDVETITINPAPTDTRYVELCYTAQFVEVEDETSFLMIPEDGHDALIDFATAECVRANDDSLADTYTQAGMTKLSLFLELVRDRQLQDTRTVEPYLSE